MQGFNPFHSKTPMLTYSSSSMWVRSISEGVNVGLDLLKVCVCELCVSVCVSVCVCCVYMYVFK